MELHWNTRVVSNQPKIRSTDEFYDVFFKYEHDFSLSVLMGVDGAERLDFNWEGWPLALESQLLPYPLDGDDAYIDE